MIPRRPRNRPGSPSLRPLPTARVALLAALLACALASCRKDELFTDSPSAQLVLNEDTVFFDTIFTTVGSVTKRFTVRNPNSEGVRVDIALAGGAPSPFRINVDGAAGLSFDDVEIASGDSIYVFVEATLDANNANNPLVIEDHIRFVTNGNEQRVLLVAWGQDAHFFRPDRGGGGFPPYSIIAGLDDSGAPTCETVHWTNDKPYVLYGYGVVDSCSTLIIDPGVRIYVHGGGGLWVYRDGRVLAQGTYDAHITFQSDRLEATYADLPGQWDRIWINDGQAGNDNVFEHVDIKNALIGIQSQSWVLTPGQPTSANTLVLNNVSIRNCSAAGILSENYRIRSTNLLVADCGQFCVALTGGGQYDFNQCTLANFWSYDIRQDPAFALTNSFTDIGGNTQVREIESSTFRNGIIEGNLSNEFKLGIDAGAGALFEFRNFLFRTDQSTSGEHFPDPGSIYRNQSPGFADASDGDYHLVPNAFAINRGALVADPVADFDLDNVFRGDGQPDLGCYEATE